MNNKLVSFDFDYTLSRKCVQEFAKELQDMGYEIIIITSRKENYSPYSFCDNSDIFEVMEQLNITEVYFTNLCHKVHEIVIHKPIIHFDDDSFELQVIRDCKKCKTIPISVWNTSSWRQKTLRILKNL